MKKNPHPPTGRQARRQGALTERRSSRLFSEGAVASPTLRAPPSLLLLSEFRLPPPPSSSRLGPLDSLALCSASFQTPEKNTHTSTGARQCAPCAAQRHDERARAPPVLPVGITGDTERVLTKQVVFFQAYDYKCELLVPYREV